MPTADVDAKHTIIELTHTTMYDVYVAVEDSATPVRNRLDTVKKVEFSTALDTEPPTFPTGFPDVFGIADTDFYMSFQLSEPGTVHYVVLQDPEGGVAPKPNPSDLIVPEVAFPTVPHGSVDVPVVGETVTTYVEGLVLSTSYSVYVIAQDKAVPTRNRQVDSTRLSVFTVEGALSLWAL